MRIVCYLIFSRIRKDVAKFVACFKGLIPYCFYASSQGRDVLVVWSFTGRLFRHVPKPRGLAQLFYSGLNDFILLLLN